MADRYKIYEKLGMGGVGAVFRAYDSQLKRWVAIKRLMTAAEASTTDDETQAELRREADALASLRNPNIVTIFDVASDEEGLFIVMELLTGEDLADVVGRGPLPYDDFKELANQTLEGLLAAHQHHILHRDIKPENIKVERLPGGRLASKIIDFGLARAGLKARKQTEDQSGTVMGSIHYMAPEQLTREPVDERTDLYSLGCVFYEALSGRKAFDGASMGEVIDKHINHEVVALSEIAPHVPHWLGVWVARLMAGKPEERPVNAQQAIEEFRAWEKMPAMAPYGQWGAMPPIYPPQQAYPGSYTQPMYYGTGTVPLQHDPSAYTQPPPVVEMAVPVAEAVAPRVVAQPRPTAPGPRRPGPTSQPTTPPKGVKAAGSGGFDAKKKLVFIVGGGLALAIGGFILLRGGNSTDATPSVSGDKPAAPSSLFPGGDPPTVIEQLPTDRSFPPVDQNICIHLASNVGWYANRRGSDGKPAKANTNEQVVAWRDLSARGGDNMLRSEVGKTDIAPRRIYWPIIAGEPAAKGNRWVLDFHPAAGKPPCAMSLADPGKQKAFFPFGGEATPGATPGMTLVVAFQADKNKLPMKLLSLSNGSSQVVIKVLQGGAIEAAFINGSDKRILSKDVNASSPCVAAVWWDKASGEVGLRARDANGRSFSSSPGSKVTAPSEPLNRLQIGKSASTGETTPKPEEQFVGYLAEVIMYSATLKLDQLQLLDGNVVASYFLDRAPSPKPLKERVTVKLPMLGNGSAWKLSADRNPGELRLATDGSTSSRWKTNESQKPGRWFKIELPAAAKIAGLALDSEGTYNDYPRSYVVETSTDDKSWSKVAEGKGSALTEITFASVTAKFVRITLTGTEPKANWGINELAIFEGK